MVFNKQGKHRIKTKVKDVKEGHSEAGKVTESIEEVKASSFFFIFFILFVTFLSLYTTYLYVKGKR